MSVVRVEGLTKVFGKSVVAVDDLSLAAHDGEFLVLVGPSGSGKTTVLRMIAGLEEPTSGHIFIGTRDVTNVRPRDRDIAMVFQDYALYPQLSVRDNLSFGLKRRKVPSAEIELKIRELATVLQLEDLLQRRPGQLSGGQRQRVALGRAIARQPTAFLMDEPLSNLDANLRTSMRGVLAQLRERLRTTTIYVTHDQVEAMTLGDRVAIMRGGRIEQLGPPQELYERPANLFVAAFIGSPHINLVEAHLHRGMVDLAGTTLPAVPHAALASYDNRTVIVGVRPADLEDAALVPSAESALDVRIAVRNDLGSEVQLFFGVDAKPIDRPDVALALEGADLGERDLVGERTSRSMFTAQVGSRTQLREGDVARIAIDPTRLFFFDPSTGELIAAPQDAYPPRPLAQGDRSPSGVEV